MQEEYSVNSSSAMKGKQALGAAGDKEESNLPWTGISMYTHF